MIPVVTPEEMAGVDRSAPEPTEVLVARAGHAVARSARAILGGTYGRRVLVVAGPGNNGADGLVAGRVLQTWGAKVSVIEAGQAVAGRNLGGRDPLDLIVDAAYGTGLSRPYLPADPGSAPVLAVDIPSGLSGLTGLGQAMTAVRTVTFEAYKPGLLLGKGPDRCGPLDVATIGLSALVADAARAWVVADGDVRSTLPERGRQGHKWQSAVLVVGGSPAMNGAPLMVARTAMRAGAGYALVGVPGSDDGGGMPPGEQVGLALPRQDWDRVAAGSAGRVHALAVGPGLGAAARGPNGETGADTPVGRFLLGGEAATTAAVVDADAITSLGSVEAVRLVTAGRSATTVLTPHEGEYKRLTGHQPLDDRIADVRHTASQTGAVILLKGSPTVVAEPGGRVLIVTSGSSRLATAGTGDALTGVIAAFLARGLPGLEAAAMGAHVHGRAAAMGRPQGLIASDLADLVSEWLSAGACAGVPA